MPPWASEIQPTQITFDEIYIAISVLIFVATTGYLMYKVTKENGGPDINSFHMEEMMLCSLFGLATGLGWIVFVPILIVLLPIWLVASKLAKRNRKEHKSG